MFDLGMQELVVIFVVALIVFGPKRLPEIGRTVGKGLQELKKAMSGVKEQIDEEMRQTAEPLAEQKEYLAGLGDESRPEKKVRQQTGQPPAVQKEYPEGRNEESQTEEKEDKEVDG
ncbi:MAG: Sec-independent protein translocase protein TatB [Thermodesulfovibrionales bacterium]